VDVAVDFEHALPPRSISSDAPSGPRPPRVTLPADASALTSEPHKLAVSLQLSCSFGCPERIHQFHVTHLRPITSPLWLDFAGIGLYSLAGIAVRSIAISGALV